MEEEIVQGDNVPQQYVKVPKLMSKNLFSERKRREKMNGLLYSLRMLVPKISKMDKASVLVDAIDHVQELRKKVDTAQAEIQSLLHSRKSSDQPAVEERNGLIIKSTLGRHEYMLKADAWILETSRIIDLRIRCKNGASILTHLSRAAASLPFSLKNASFNTLGDDLLVHFILQMKAEPLLTNQIDVKQMIVDAFSREGFSFVLAGDQLPSNSHELE